MKKRYGQTWDDDEQNLHQKLLPPCRDVACRVSTNKEIASCRVSTNNETATCQFIETSNP